jgi:hypothetical protein
MRTTRTAKLLSLLAGATAVVGLSAGAAHAIYLPNPDPGFEIAVPPIVDPCVQFPVICDGDITTPTTDPDPTPTTTVPDMTPDTTPEPTGDSVPEAQPAVVVQATPNFTG